MPTYKVYLIDASGQVRTGESFEKPADGEALAKFRSMDREGLIAELWQGGRLLRKLPRDKA